MIRPHSIEDHDSRSVIVEIDGKSMMFDCTFDKLRLNPDWAEKIEQKYCGSLDRLSALVGIKAQQHMAGQK